MFGPAASSWSAAGTIFKDRALFDAAGLTSDADTTPLEIRLQLTGATAGTITVDINEAGPIPIVDIVGTTI